ncbi:MAG TPA: hypothetical protein VGN42_01800 [Pirellulales bacterium]|nr:hypothetical protein [Pirellulales bacterium]
MKPVLQALLLADRVFEDGATGKKIIAGTFNTLAIGDPRLSAEPSAPAGEEAGPVKIKGGMDPGSPYAYFSITEVCEPIDVVLRYVDLEDDSILLQTTIHIECADPLVTVEGVAALPRLPTPHIGIYALELLHNEELLGCHRVRVIRLKEQ